MRIKAKRNVPYGAKSLYLRTHYKTPQSCGLCPTESEMIPLAEWIRRNETTRRKAEDLLKKGYLLATYYHNTKPRGQYYVMENPNQPISELELRRRVYSRGRNRKKSNSRGTYQSEAEYYSRMASHTSKTINVDTSDNWETPNWFEF